MEIRYDIAGIDCPNCASKIERALGKLPDIQRATLDFAQSKLYVQVREAADVAAVEADMAKVFCASEEGACFVRAEERTDDEAERRLLPPHGDANGALAALAAAGIDAYVAQGAVVLRRGESWMQTLAAAEAALPGLAPEAVRRQEVVDDGEAARRRERRENRSLLAGAALFAAGIAAKYLLAQEAASLILFAAAYVLCAAPVLVMTAKSILRLDPFDENFLMSAATLGAFAIGEAPEGVAVMLLYRLGEYLQGKAVRRSRQSIRAMMKLKPDYANLLFGRRAVRVDPAQVRVGDAIEVRPGERVPLDGIVLRGHTSLDTKDMTGESAPRDIAVGDEALSGAINGGGLIAVQVTRPAGDSSVARVLRMVQSSSANKAKTERFFTRFARVYTPIVVLIAVLLMVVPPLLGVGLWGDWIYRGLSFLVVSCPCALVLSIPLSYFGGVGAASRRGVLVKGGESLEALARADTAVFDKTGTLTEGVMEVLDLNGEQGFSKEELLSIAARAEAPLNHPIAKAIVAAAGEVPEGGLQDFENRPGEGVLCAIDGKKVAVGNARLMRRMGHQVPAVQGTAAYVSIDGRYAGWIRIGDRPRAEAPRALGRLKRLGIKKTVMLTGDSGEAAAQVAKAIGIDEVRAQLLPDQKVEALAQVAGGGTLFIGDGVNDAPVLAAADVGIAMGGIGSDAAIEAADVVLMADDLGRIGDAIEVSRKTRVNVIQNVTLALGVKLAVMALVALGLGKMWMAVAADAGVALVCVLNALRLSYGGRE